MKDRLGLDVSPEKSRIVNLKRQYSEFLGFKLKVQKRSNKYVVKSHLCDKAYKKVQKKLTEEVKKLEHSADDKAQFMQLMTYNAVVAGIHQYYCIATAVSEDFGKLAYGVKKQMHNRLRNDLTRKGELKKGNTYEKNRAIKCFDTVKPTLNAAVSDGLLSIQVHDTDSGAKAVYVNGYEFTELTGGTLNIRLQQFDAGYEYFTIYAMDNAGNMSEIYKTKNPYYKDPADTSDKNPAEQLPESAKPTKPGSATGTVTEHTKTDSNGNTTSQSSSPAEQKKQAMKEADAAEKAESGQTENTEKSGLGKEFYTIQTATDKVFYLVIDRDGEEEKVYFLTEITENDLLNTTSDNSETLPKNSAALESTIPNGEGALPNNNGEQTDTSDSEPETENAETAENTEDTEPEQEVKKEPNPMIFYLLMGGAAVLFIGGAYYFKVVRKKKEDFIEDEDEDEEEEEEYENEDEESEEDSEEDFFDGQEE